MRPLIIFALFILSVCSLPEAQAQFTISNVTAGEASTKPLSETLNSNVDIQTNYQSHARYLAERRRIRHERNTLYFEGSLTFNNTAFKNWASGGQDLFAGAANVLYDHTYKRNKFNFNYNFNAYIGFNVIDSLMFKNKDAFILNINPSWDLNKNWSYSGLIKFNSQFRRGYQSSDNTVLVSDFMAPGIVTVGAGFTYHHNQIPLAVRLSPVSGSMTLVLNDELAKKEAYGVDSTRHAHIALGPSLVVDFKLPMLKERLTYRSYLDAFCNYKGEKTRILWNNWIDFTVMKIFVVNLFVSAKYDQTAKIQGYTYSPAQFNYSTGVGLIYKFSNK